MKQYHKLYYYKPDLMGQNIWAFDKLDGQNLRFECNFKRGFYKFGSRTQMISDKDEQFGPALNMFLEKYSEPLMSILYKNYSKSKFDNFTVFSEYCGPNSFAGRHVEGEKLDVILFDIWLYKKGWVTPQKLIDDFGHLGIPKVIYKGKLTDSFIKDIQDDKFNLNEGVIAKGLDKQDVFMCKIKCTHWIEKIKNKFGIEYLYEDMDHNKNIILSYRV